MIRYLSLAETFWLAEQVTRSAAEVLVKVSRSDLADSALHAPQAGFGDEDLPRHRGESAVPPAGWRGVTRRPMARSAPHERLR